MEQSGKCYDKGQSQGQWVPRGGPASWLRICLSPLIANSVLSVYGTVRITGGERAPEELIPWGLHRLRIVGNPSAVTLCTAPVNSLLKFTVVINKNSVFASISLTMPSEISIITSIGTLRMGNLVKIIPKR